MDMEPATPEPAPEDSASKPPLPPVDDPAMIDMLPASAVLDDPVDRDIKPEQSHCIRQRRTTRSCRPP